MYNDQLRQTLKRDNMVLSSYCPMYTIGGNRIHVKETMRYIRRGINTFCCQLVLAKYQLGGVLECDLCTNI
jgi:hypothetical protein